MEKSIYLYDTSTFDKEPIYFVQDTKKAFDIYRKL